MNPEMLLIVDVLTKQQKGGKRNETWKLRMLHLVEARRVEFVPDTDGGGGAARHALDKRSADVGRAAAEE